MKVKATRRHIGRPKNAPENIQRVYDLGKVDCEKCIAKLIEWMKAEFK